MKQKRTGGMTTVALLNFVFAALQIGGGLFAVLVGHAALSRSFTTSEAASAATQSIGVGLSGVLVGGVGIAAGIGVLKLVPWGRVMCLVYAGMMILSNFITLFAGLSALTGSDRTGVILGSLLWMIYPVVLVGLCSTVKWREAFGRTVA